LPSFVVWAWCLRLRLFELIEEKKDNSVNRDFAVSPLGIPSKCRHRRSLLGKSFVLIF
jgi:hypothetical protein